MIGIFTVRPVDDSGPHDAFAAIGRFDNSQAVARITAGQVEGCEQIAAHAFELTGNFARALAELQAAADMAWLVSELRLFSESGAVMRTQPKPLR